jgi:uncharacterized protein
MPVRPWRRGVTATIEIPARSGTAFRLATGQVLTVIDPCGEQVADLLAYNADDVDEVISSGRSLDYADTIRVMLQ